MLGTIFFSLKDKREWPLLVGHPVYVFHILIFIYRYLPDYETLIEQLVKLHTYAAVPSVLLIDDLDNYFNDESVKNLFMHIARTCALISHSMNSCSRILKMNVSEELYAQYKQLYTFSSKKIYPVSKKH